MQNVAVVLSCRSSNSSSKMTAMVLGPILLLATMVVEGKDVSPGSASPENSCEFDGSFATCNSSFHGYHVNTHTYVDRCKTPPTAWIDVMVPRLEVSHQHVFGEGEQELDIDRWIGLRIHVFVRHETLHGVRVQVDYHIYSQPMGLLYDHEFEIDRYKCPEMESVSGDMSRGVKLTIGIVFVVAFLAALLGILAFYQRKRKSVALANSALVTNVEPIALDPRAHHNAEFQMQGVRKAVEETVPPTIGRQVDRMCFKSPSEA